MMKISHKSSHKLQKSSRDSPPERKETMRKHIHSSSMRISSSSRPPVKHPSPPGMKRGLMPPSSKNVHPTRMHHMTSTSQSSVSRPTMHGSPVAIERMSSGLKRLKYEKRKMSPSPVRHLVSPVSAAVSGPSPFLDNRYMSARPPDHTERYSSPPTRKKLRRSSERFDRDNSPVMARQDLLLRQDPRMSHNVTIPPQPSPIHTSQHHGHIASTIHDSRSSQFEMHERSRRGPSPPTTSSTHSKRPAPPMPMTPIYEDPRVDRYRSPSPRYSSPNPDKHYTLSLHERFSSVVESTRTEPRIKYTREDLEKITIDIHRNLKAESPILRRIVDPNDVKLVRRENEGHRPMFDRDEIKKASRDMRDDAHYEKKAVPSSVTMYAAHSSSYEITRQRFDPHHAAAHLSSKRSLSERWQNPEGRKEAVALDRDDREREYERQQPKRSFPEARRSKSRDQDFRSEKYTVAEVSRSRQAYPDSQRRMHSPPPMRSSSSIRHKEIPHMEARRKMISKESDREASNGVRTKMISRYPRPPEKHYPESMSMRVDKRSERRSPGIEPPKWKPKSRSDSRERYPRSESYKSDMPSRSSSYYENSRETSDSYRGRGGFRSFRSSRGFRARGFRGLSRGGMSSRSPRGGGYRSSSSFRGRGAPRRGNFSSRMWEHDMYSSGDRKMGPP